MRVAVVGTGVAGMVAARRLHDAGHAVALYEARDRFGGHTATVDVDLGPGRRYRVDTGFIVFNERTYPGFCALLDELGVTPRRSDMSFSARVDRDDVEYNGTSTRSLFAQKRNLVRPRFWRMIRDILRFYREAPSLLEAGEDAPDPTPELTLGEYLRRGGYSRAFIDWHIVPMACAVWSGVPREIDGFPARSLVRFFANHGFLEVDDRPPWLTIPGGSRTYAEALLAPLMDDLRLSSPVSGVAPRLDGRVEVTSNGATETFDRAVLACHSDQALAMLREPTTAEREVLGAIRYQPNEVVLHTDPTVMPRRRGAWAAWNVWSPEDRDIAGDPVRVTYWMNQLQSLDGPDDLFVSLNTSEHIDPARIIESKVFHHPIFDAAAVRAQGRFEEIDGARGVHYAGAYWSFGFHEDGVQSARRALVRMGVDPRLPDRPIELRPGHAEPAGDAATERSLQAGAAS